MTGGNNSGTGRSTWVNSSVSEMSPGGRRCPRRSSEKSSGTTLCPITEEARPGRFLSAGATSRHGFQAQLWIFPKANLVVAAFVNRGGEREPSPPLQAVLAVACRYATK
jgi:hypothetical protein